MKIDVLNSPLRCPKCSKRMVMELGENEAEGDAGHEAVHRCWNCDHVEVETGRTVPLASVTDSVLARIRDRIRDDAMEAPIDFEWPVKS